MDSRESKNPSEGLEQSEDYTPKSILITGGAGFIGSHVAIRLSLNYPQYKVVILDKLDTCASLENLASVRDKDNVKFVQGDIQSHDLVKYILSCENIDTVMHFAAQTHVDNSFGNSLAFTMNNTYGTHVLLECCRVARTVRRFINVSTDEVYGETSLGSQEGLREQSNLEPTNPYSAAKAGAEMMCRAYMTSYGMPIIITRGNNVYGPHQFPEKLVPKLIILASKDKSLPVHGDGQNVRSYLYVEDVAEAYDIILHKGLTGETYNVGTKIERSVLDVCQDIQKHFSLSKSEIQFVKDRAFNDRRYFIGSEKLVSLGWKQSTSWEDGLKKTIDWYLKHGVDYWDAADVEMALEPHPFFPSSELKDL